MGILDGQVAFITGVARGQGRSHAVRLAQEGADIVGLDLCAPIEAVPYPLATPGDLEETAQLVEKTGRRIIARRGDVRDRAQVQAVVDAGMAEFGRLDIVIANAGIAPVPGAVRDPFRMWEELIAVNLSGAYYTVRCAVPAMIQGGRGGSVVLISSTMGIKGAPYYPASEGYIASKHGVVGLMRSFANELGAHSIRVNSVHPTGVETMMIMNEATQNFIQSDPSATNALTNLLPVPYLQPSDISDAVAWLVSPSARYVTGVILPVDAGYTIR